MTSDPDESAGAHALPPKPASRPPNATLLQRLRLFREDMFASQPERLYRAWMAETRTPFYRSYLVNDPALVHEILNARPDHFPKSTIIGDTLRALLGASVFVTNGEAWKAQRRIIDPAFAGGRLHRIFPAMVEAGHSAADRLSDAAGSEPVEMESRTAHAAADVIFRTLFSKPIEDEDARAVYTAFQRYQRASPLLSPMALLRLPRWIPRFPPRAAVQSARDIRSRLRTMIAERADAIDAGTAPDDLATAIMTGADPQTGARFSREDMLDQVAIFFLAGHETSASALAWALYLLATHPEVQDKVAGEVATLGDEPRFSDIKTLSYTRDVFRETLRLYPPVPMMVRQAARDETFRKRTVRRGSLMILSPWHLHRHERIWTNPDRFDPDRWSGEDCAHAARKAYMPFSSGPRVCTGAGFAMLEGVLLLAILVRRFRFKPCPGRAPRPVAHLTVRAKDGIWLDVRPR